MKFRTRRGPSQRRAGHAAWPARGEQQYHRWPGHARSSSRSLPRRRRRCSPARGELQDAVGEEGKVYDVERPAAFCPLGWGSNDSPFFATGISCRGLPTPKTSRARGA
eukprot:9002317-Alexandrium_andersonii.AAC.1